ncbi:hypothetical protein D3C81_745690 [compost metagenome]
MTDNEDKWVTPSRGDFDFDEMIENIKDYIKSDPEYQYQVLIGADAQTHPKHKTTRYVTVVIARRVGKGAQYYLKKENLRMANSLDEKIWHEATSAYSTIEKVREALEGFVDKSNIIPHVDIGEVGETRDLIAGVRGMFIGSGYDNIQIKPYSYAASGVADKHSK